MTDRRGFLAGALALVAGGRANRARGNGSHLDLDRASERQTVVDFDPKWANGSHLAMGSRVQWLTKDDGFLEGMPTVGHVIGIRQRYWRRSPDINCPHVGYREARYYVDFGRLQLWISRESLRVLPPDEGTSVGFYGKFPQAIR